MKRREFIGLVGGAAVAWPLALRAQQRAIPVIGFLNAVSPYEFADRLRGFHRGLKETGYVEGENVAIEFRWAEDQLDRLPVLAAELVRRQVAVIVSGAGPTVPFAAKAATTTIPIVFLTAEDPVRLGLVASLARQGANLTGINFFTNELVAKRLELLRELVPGATRVAVLANPIDAQSTKSTLRDVEAVVHAMGLQIQVLKASTSSEISAAFATFVREPPDAVFVSAVPFFTSRRVQLTHLATFHRVPLIAGSRLFAEAGGLMSYGASLTDAFRQVGTYVGRILRRREAGRPASGSVNQIQAGHRP